jgi:hypothetical protein
VQWGPTTRRIRENASDQSVEDGLGLDDQVSGDQLQQKVGWTNLTKVTHSAIPVHVFIDVVVSPWIYQAIDRIRHGFI